MTTGSVERCRRRFLRFFPGGFKDQTYLEWERNYKVAAAREWHDALARPRLGLMLKSGRYREVAAIALRIESRTNLLFSFEKRRCAMRRVCLSEPAGSPKASMNSSMAVVLRRSGSIGGVKSSRSYRDGRRGC